MFSPRFALAFVIALIAVVSLAPTSAQAADKLYGGVIVLPADAADLKVSADDAAQVLGKMTGHPFVVQSDAAEHAIRLVRADADDAPADMKKQLAEQGRQPFVIRSTGDDLWIVANGDVGLSFGLYYYLEQLGVRFYLPNEHWTIIPPRTDITLAIDKLVAPDFINRGFFGTGGFGGDTPVDPTRQLATFWNEWKRRNRFGADFGVAGHTGELFNMQHQKTLMEHPEYRAELNGKRVEYSKTSKFCASNPEVLDLYIQDRVRNLNFQKTKYPGILVPTVSVEPADGGGHCECEKCRKIGSGSVSDRVFYVANQVAKAVAKEDPKALVTLLAYNKHAAVPTLELEPNIFVQVVPYGFQRTGLTGDELLAAWHQRVGELSVYDYWSIPDWVSDTPVFNYLKTLGQKIRYWHEQGSIGFSSESTHSGGAMGLAWYIAGRLMWDVDLDERQIADEFYQTAFGPAAAPMKRMMERWATTGFALTDHELGLSFHDLDEAMKLAGNDAAVRARIVDFGRYVQYLRLHYEIYAKPSKESVDALAHYLWCVYDSRMIHSFRLYQLLARNHVWLHEAYLASGRGAVVHGPAWDSVRPHTDDEIVAMMAAGVKDYQPLDFDEHHYDGQLVLLEHNSGPVSEELPAFQFSSSVTFELLATEGQKSLKLEVYPHTRPARVKLIDADGQRIVEHEVPVETLQTLELPLAKPGRYSIEVYSPKSRVTIRPPQGVALTMHDFMNSQGAPLPPLSMYVPKDVKTLAVIYSYPLMPSFFDSEGKEVTPRSGSAPGIVLYDVPEGQSGKVWKLTKVKTPKSMRMLNVPHLFGLYPDAMLVPADALK